MRRWTETVGYCCLCACQVDLATKDTLYEHLQTPRHVDKLQAAFYESGLATPWST